MTPDEFAESLFVVTSSGVAGFLRYLRSPAGRTPPRAWVARSSWFNSLDDMDRSFVEDLVRESAIAAARTFCGVLDGSVAIESQRTDGTLVLTYEAPGGKSIRLNDAEQLELDLAFAEVVHRD